MSFLDKVELELTPSRRLKLYQLAVVIGTLLTIHQVTTADTVAAYLQSLALLLGTGVPALAARNTPKQ